VTVEASNEEEAVNRAWAQRGDGYIEHDDRLEHAVARELNSACASYLNEPRAFTVVGGMAAVRAA
jgi:hypothetical protein